MPYLSMDAEGTILDLNLAAAILLGVKRSQKGRYRVAALLTEASLSTFQRFIDDVLAGKTKSYCDVVVAATPQHADTLVRLEGVPDEDGKECRVVMSIVRTGETGQADRRISC